MKFVRKMDDVEAFEEAECRDGGVKIEAGRKTCAERERDDLERVHGRGGNSLTGAIQKL